MKSNDGTPEGYYRPQQKWLCGLAETGPPCPLGPDPNGRCPRASACRPVREGDRWLCNRSGLRGGPCEQGPSPEGECCITYCCTPVRGLRTKRGKFVAGVMAAAVGSLLMSLGGSWRETFVAPGPLSKHHAQIMARHSGADKCAHCHSPTWGWNAAAGALGGGLGSAAPDVGRGSIAQSSLCMACHAQTIQPDLALAAHNMPLDELRAAADGAGEDGGLLWKSPRRDPAAAIACAACHREHQGAGHDLAAMTNHACQACHQERYHSLADGHPEFGNWPYGQPTQIAFDHRSHGLKHFPEQQREFACTACHRGGSQNQRQLTLGYEESCASCHDKTIDASMADGIALLSLPTVDTEALSEAGHEVGPWPKEAKGDFDGALPLAAKLLIAADPAGSAALEALGAGFDYYDVDPDDGEQLKAAADAARATQALISEIAERGQAAIVERLEAVIGRPLEKSEREALVGRLSPDVAAAYRERWLGSGAPSEDRAALAAKVRAGGWIRDELTLSLRYVPMGHADPWMRAWLDILAEAASGPRSKTAERLLEAALKPTAAGQCGSCHRTERDGAGRARIHWSTFEPPTSSGLTYFSHRAHLAQLELRDCRTCHVLNEGSATEAGIAAEDFAPMSKGTCVACHTRGAAGDDCTQCHRYHAGHSPSVHSEGAVLSVETLLER